MSKLQGPGSGVVGRKDEEWSGSGKAEQLLQQQLKNVQEECRRLREAYRHSDGNGSQLSLNSQSSSSKLRPPIDASPPSLPPSHHTPLTSYHSTPSQNTHITPSLNPQLSLSMASLSSVRSTQSELAPPTMMSPRYHQTHKQGGGKKGTRKKVTAHNLTQREVTSKTSKGGSMDHVPFKIDSTSSSYGGWQQQEKEDRRKTGKHLLDSGYSSGSGPTPRVGLHLSAGQLSAGNKEVTSRNAAVKVSSALFSGSPSLSHPVCVRIPASVHVVGRGGGEHGGREESKGDLERGRVRQLEHEVTVLEQQLSEKTQAARSHVEDVTCLRSELARERAALARERQESREAAGVQLRREKAAHEEQCRNLTRQLERLQGEKREGDREIGTLRASLKVSETEALRLSETVSRLTMQLEQERESHTSATRSLHSAAEEGRTKVAELEQSLRACHDDVSGHIVRLEEMERAYQAQVDTLKNKVSSLDAALSGATSQLQEKTTVISELRAEFGRTQAQHDHQLRGRAESISQLQEDLTQLRAQKEREREEGRSREEDLRQSLAHSDEVRQSLLLQVEKNRQELERLTERLSVVQGREGEVERSRAETEQLKKIVSELQRSEQDKETEIKEAREDRQRLQVQLGHLQAQLESANSELLQARNREAEYSQATAELIKEAGQVRAESGRVKSQLEASQWDLQEVRRQLREKEASLEGSETSVRQELATRTQQVLEMEKLLRTQQTESTSRRLELERKLTQCQSDLQTRTQQLEHLTVQLSQSQKAAEQLHSKVAELQCAEQSHCSDREKEISSKDAELAVLRNRLHSLTESHSAVLASSEQLASTHRKAEAQVAEQLQMRQQELSRTRAQVSSLSTELAGEKKAAEELRSQLTLARAEAARHQAQVSSMQRSSVLGNMAALGLVTGNPHPSTSSTTSTDVIVAKPATAHKRTTLSTASKSSSKPEPPVASSTAGQKKGQVIDL